MKSLQIPLQKYIAPVCTELEALSEGVLCSSVSFTNESFGNGDDGARTYGTGETDRGWF